MGNKRKLSVDYLNIVFKSKLMFLKRAILSVIDGRVLGLDLDVI